MERTTDKRSHTLMSSIWQGFQIILPIYPWFSQKTKQTYRRNVFREMIESSTTWKSFIEMLEDFKSLRNKYLGYNLVNSETFLMRNNQKFEFDVFGNKFCLWDDCCQSLGEFEIDLDEVPSKEFVEWVESRTGEYCEGAVHCSCCGRVMREKDIRGRYFAGVYCEDCWNTRGWKAKAERETYD